MSTNIDDSGKLTTESETGKPFAQENGKPTPLLPIVFDTSSAHYPAAFEASAPIGVAVCSIGLLSLCVFFAMDATLYARVWSIIAGILYLIYVVYYFTQFFQGRGCYTKTMLLTEEMLEITCGKWKKRLPLNEVVFTMSFSGPRTFCILAATENDYAIAVCSVGYLLTRDGKKVVTPLYKINQWLMVFNPKHINYTKHRRYRKKNPFRIPQFMFEVEFDTKRVGHFVESLRNQYRFR